MEPKPGDANAGGHEGFDVARNGDGRVALIGFPSVGTKVERSSYSFAHH